MSDIKLSVWRDGRTGQIQLEIGDETTGYRIAGPKFNGGSELLLAAKLSERDIKEIRAYLDEA